MSRHPLTRKLTTDDGPLVVWTDGYDLYERVKRGTYRKLYRSGNRTGITATDFQPRVRWRRARLCTYEIATDGLTCPRCGLYDTHYAMTGDRSYCKVQKGR